VAKLTPEQRRTRDRVEKFISLVAPALNLVLAAGDRLSRIVEPEDSEYYPVRSGMLEPEGGEPQGGSDPAARADGSAGDGA
jgi:hypothetical protein